MGMAISTASPKSPRLASSAAEAAEFLDGLLRKLRIPNQILLTVVGCRLLAEQKTTANDLWRMLSLRGEAKAAETVAQIGDAISAEGIGRLLDIQKSAVHKAKKENRLLAFSLPARVGDFFPVFQIEKGKVQPWIPRLLRFIGNGLPAIQFLTVKRKSLEGESYFDLLRDGQRPEVIDAMLAHAEGIGDPASKPLPKLSTSRPTGVAA
jgi:hypothetical protein